MEEYGWISLYRKFTEHEFWKEKRTFSKAEAWLDLLLCANHKDKHVTLGMKKVLCKRGQSVRSKASWAKRWGWSRTKVDRFLVYLENDAMIVQQTTTRTSIITICNYETYQDTSATNVHEKSNKRASNVHQTCINNNDNNIISCRSDVDQVEDGVSGSGFDNPQEGLFEGGKEQLKQADKKSGDRISSETVEAIYQQYPRKEGKQAALKKIRKDIKTISKQKTISELEAAEWLKKRTTIFADSQAGRNKKYIPMASTWFNGNRWADDPKEWENWRDSGKLEKTTSNSNGHYQPKAETLTREEAEAKARDLRITFNPGNFQRVSNNPERFVFNG